MKIRVMLSHASKVDSGVPTRLARESTRMGIYALCLKRLGHDVYFCNPNQALQVCKRWELFAALFASDRLNEKPDVIIQPAEDVKLAAEMRKVCDRLVGIKLRKNFEDDIGSRYDVYMAHEYNWKRPEIEAMPSLLPVPWIVHNNVIQWMIETGKFELYIYDQLEEFRSLMPVKDMLAGFIGGALDGRPELAAQMPDWVHFDWRSPHREDGLNYEAGDYMQRLSRYRVGIHFPGDTPKANRFAENILLGNAVAMCPCPVRDTPPVTKDNVILLADYKDHQTLHSGVENAEHFAAKADECYKDGWSPMGQMKQVIRRLT